MDYLLAALLALVCIFVTWWTRKQSQRELQRQAELIAALTRRIYSLEKPETPAERQPEPTPAPTPAPIGSPPDNPKDWETVVGTDWLNRAGALLLVIGVALFLGYSLTQLGAVGKVAIGIGAGLAMLLLGVASERFEKYRSFSMGLTGGGWAILYFTAYAAHAIPESRLIDSPAAGMLLLLTVSAGMVAHSLHYGSETATTLGFFFAFAALNATPATRFTLISTGCLAAALLGISVRFGWNRLSTVGVLLTYGTYLLRGDTSSGFALLWLYWALFEAFDLFAILRGQRPSAGMQHSLVYLNACGFVGSALLKSWSIPSQQWFVFFLFASVAFGLSSFLRARYTREQSGQPEGGYEAAAAFSAAAMGGAILYRYSGLSIALALVVEGQMIFLAGVFLANLFFRRLGGAVLGAAFLRFFSVDFWESETIEIARLTLHRWTPLALLMTAVFSVNRWLSGARLASLAATLLLGAVVASDFQTSWATVTWALLAFLVMVAGVRWNAFDLRMQGYVAAVFCLLKATIGLVDGRGATIAACFTAAMLYAGQWVLRRMPRHLQGAEKYASVYLSVIASFLIVLVLYDAVDGGWLTVAIAIQAGVSLAVGFARNERTLRLTGLVLFLFCLGKVFLFDLRELDTLSRILSFVILGLLLLGASWVYTRFKDKIRQML